MTLLFNELIAMRIPQVRAMWSSPNLHSNHQLSPAS